jgi:probable rRNA maturation factor
MINIEIRSEFKRLFSSGLLEKAATAALDQQAAPDADLTIVLTDDATLLSLDREFLGKSAPTDVLSFPASETDPETGRLYLGDIIISAQRAEIQSGARGHSLEAELSLLVVHGVLHLLGHDHAVADEKERMWSAQTDILTRLGISPTIVPD